MKTLIPALLFLAPAAAFAHPGHEGLAGFAPGFFHPLLGLDHLLAAIAVGIWAARMRRSAALLLPAAFLFGMAMGGAQGISGLAFPYYDAGILISLAVLGLGLFTTVKLPVSQGCAMLALFGWLHGNAHGAELGSHPGTLAFAGGFLLATAMLHAAGIASMVLLERATSPRWLRAYSCAAGAVCLIVTGLFWLG